MRQSFIIGIVVCAQLSASLVFQVLIIRFFGVGAETDSYIAAQTVPLVLVAIIITAFQSVWLPRLSLLADDFAAWRSEQAIAQGQVALLGCSVLLLVAFGAPIWLRLLFPGLDSVQQQSALVYTYILLAAGVFNIQSALLTVALRAYGRFVIAESTTLLGIFASLVCLYFLLPVGGMLAVVWIIFVRSVVTYLLQLHLASWPSISLQLAISTKKTWQLMWPLFFGTSIYKTSPIVDRYWASQAGIGGITILNLAQTAMGALAKVLEHSICVPLIPSFSRRIRDNDYEGLRKSYRQGVLIISVIVVLLAVLMLIAKPLFISLFVILLGLQDNIANSLWLTCFFLLGYLHVAASGHLPVSVFYALGDTKTPVQIGLVGFIISIIAKLVGYTYFGLLGLSIAISLYYFLNLIVMCLYLEKHIDEKIYCEAR